MPGVAGIPEFTIACCADSTLPVLRDLARLIRAQGPDLVLFAGDARPRGVGIGRIRAWRWRAAWGGLATRVITVPGNHDYGRDGDPWRWRGMIAAGRRGLVSSPTGAFMLRREGLRIAGFDCGPGADRIPESQIAWAREAFGDGDDAGHRVAICHAPAFPVSEHIGSSLDAHPAARDAFWESLEDCGVSLLLCGHEHVYARRTVDRRVPVTQVITGGAGAQSTPLLSPEVDASGMGPHIVLLHLLGPSIEGVAMTPNGLVLDRFSIPARRTAAPDPASRE